MLFIRGLTTVVQDLNKFGVRLLGCLLFSTSFSNIWLSLAPSAFADLQQPPGSKPPPPGRSVPTGTRGYEPPPGVGVPPGESGSTGSRGVGCSEEDGLGLTLLAPQGHVGQTVTPYPTLSWFVPTDASLEGGVRIIGLDDNGEPEELLEEYSFTSTQGFMTFTLPDESEALEPGERYRWQVYLECNSRSTNDEFAEAAIDVVEPERSPSPLADDPIEKASQLASSGVWYDAIAVLLETDEDPDAKAYLNELLLDLAALEALEKQEDDESVEDSELSFSESLERIAE